MAYVYQLSETDEYGTPGISWYTTESEARSSYIDQVGRHPENRHVLRRYTAAYGQPINQVIPPTTISGSDVVLREHVPEPRYTEQKSCALV